MLLVVIDRNVCYFVIEVVRVFGLCVDSGRMSGVGLVIGVIGIVGVFFRMMCVFVLLILNELIVVVCGV